METEIERLYPKNVSGILCMVGVIISYKDMVPTGASRHAFISFMVDINWASTHSRNLCSRPLCPKKYFQACCFFGICNTFRGFLFQSIHCEFDGETALNHINFIL